MNTFFGIESDKCMKNDATIGFSELAFSRPSSPEITFSSPDAESLDADSSSPEPASLDDNESIIVPFPDDDNVSAPQPQPPQPQPAQLYPAQPQPRTISVEEWTHLIHDSPEECIRCCKAKENKQYVRRSYRPRKASNWIFLYRIQRNEGNWITMEEITSIKQKTCSLVKRKRYGVGTLVRAQSTIVLDERSPPVHTVLT